MARFLAERLQEQGRIRHDEFLAELRTGLTRFFETVRGSQEVVALYGGNHPTEDARTRSSYWAIHLAQKLGYRFTEIADLKDLGAILKRRPRATFVYLDDATYSGTQLFGISGMFNRIIKENGQQQKLNVVVPFYAYPALALVASQNINFFDHKMPDYQSFPSFLRSGQVYDETGNPLKKGNRSIYVPFILEASSPYH